MKTKAQAVSDFLDKWPDAEWGPAHIVLSDHNWERADIAWCQGHVKEKIRELQATLDFLVTLLELPE